MLKSCRKSTFWYPTTGKALFPTQTHKIEDQNYFLKKNKKPSEHFGTKEKKTFCMKVVLKV